MTKDEAISLFGSPAKLARALAISKGAVSQWPDDQIPELRALQIEKIQAARANLEAANSSLTPFKQAS